MIPLNDSPNDRAAAFAAQVDSLVDAGLLDQEAYERLLRQAQELDVGLPTLIYLENHARRAGIQTHGVSLLPAQRRLWTPSSLK